MWNLKKKSMNNSKQHKLINTENRVGVTSWEGDWAMSEMDEGDQLYGDEQ